MYIYIYIHIYITYVTDNEWAHERPQRDHHIYIYLIGTHLMPRRRSTRGRRPTCWAAAVRYSILALPVQQYKY